MFAGSTRMVGWSLTVGTMLLAAHAQAAPIGLGAFDGSETLITFNEDRFATDSAAAFDDLNDDGTNVSLRNTSVSSTTPLFSNSGNDVYYTAFPSATRGRVAVIPAASGQSGQATLTFDEALGIYKLGMLISARSNGTGNYLNTDFSLTAYGSGSQSETLDGSIFDESVDGSSTGEFVGLETTFVVTSVVISFNLANPTVTPQQQLVIDDLRYAIPEPASLALLGIGSLLMFGRRR